MFSILVIIHFVAWALLLDGLSDEMQEEFFKKCTINTLMALPDDSIIVRVSSCIEGSDDLKEKIAKVIFDNLPAFHKTTETGFRTTPVDSGHHDMDDDEPMVGEVCMSDWINSLDDVYTNL